ncbi:hypothetical protein WA1_18990 [Scytonema hofmannii PCC 7110]|uniref:Hint domain-containing protein n=1 Tax=Scytonema hofmannii PCC 7110 TaxID=128403 RepID=A0A139XBK2_9CYAN|nr:tape measure protein [Scytonema hofmannii]KYC42088.1 hypothetical protein WA1_18990 [Scytonema hofmannii PCC 7110]
MKNVAINVKLGLDTAEFSRKIEGMGSSFKPLEVPVRLKSLGLDAGFANVRVKADLDPNTLTPSLTASLKTAFGTVTAKLGDDIGTSVSKAVKELKPSTFGNLISSITAPFRQVATGALEGVGLQLSAKLGQGLAKGLEQKLSPTIGSFDLLGEALLTKKIAPLFNELNKSVEIKKLFNLDESAEIGKIFNSAVKEILDENDVIIARNAQIYQDRTQAIKQKKSAIKAVGQDLSDAVADSASESVKATENEKVLKRDLRNLRQEISQNETKTKQLKQQREEVIAKALDATSLQFSDAVTQEQAVLKNAKINKAKNLDIAKRARSQGDFEKEKEHLARASRDEMRIKQYVGNITNLTGEELLDRPRKRLPPKQREQIRLDSQSQEMRLETEIGELGRYSRAQRKQLSSLENQVGKAKNRGKDRILAALKTLEGLGVNVKEVLFYDTQIDTLTDKLSASTTELNQQIQQQQHEIKTARKNIVKLKQKAREGLEQSNKPLAQKALSLIQANKNVVVTAKENIKLLEKEKKARQSTTADSIADSNQEIIKESARVVAATSASNKSLEVIELEILTKSQDNLRNVKQSVDVNLAEIKNLQKASEKTSPLYTELDSSKINELKDRRNELKAKIEQNQKLLTSQPLAGEQYTTINNSISEDLEEVGKLDEQLKSVDLAQQIQEAKLRREKLKRIILKAQARESLSKVKGDYKQSARFSNLVDTLQAQLQETEAIIKKATSSDQYDAFLNESIKSAQARKQRVEKSVAQQSQRNASRIAELKSSAFNAPQQLTTKAETQAQVAHSDKAKEIYERIGARVLKTSESLSGTKITGKLPPLIPDDLKAGSYGSYTPDENSIRVSKEVYGALRKGDLTHEITEALVHELRHALQFGLGESPEGTAIKNLIEPTTQEQDRLSDRIKNSVANSGASDERKGQILALEKDAYTFADRYTQEIYNHVRGISEPQNIKSLKGKFTEKQKEFKVAYRQAQEQLEESLTAENKAALEQLTKVQLKAIAKSSGVKGYSQENIADLRELLLKKVKAEELSFKIPTFSKVDPKVQQDVAELLQFAPNELKQNVRELSQYLSQTTKQAGKTGDVQALRQVLDGISDARKIYASALAQDLDKETRGLLQAAIATLGKQRIAAQNRLTPLSAQELNPTATQLGAQPQSQQITLYGFRNNSIDRELKTLRQRLQQRSSVIKGQAAPNFNEVNNLINRVTNAAKDVDAGIDNLIRQVNQQVSQQLIGTDTALKRLAAIAKLAETRQKQRAQLITKNAEEAFKRSQQALKELETQTNQRVAEIEARGRYKEQQRSSQMRERLNRYGIEQTAPVDIVEQAPQRQPFSVAKFANRVRSEFQEFRVSGAKKQAEALGQQAKAILVDLDSQIAIGKASAAEAKVVQKAIAENEKHLVQILNTIKRAKAGKEPALTPGDLQRLSGQAGQLGQIVDADKTRLAELAPQVEKGKRLQPVAQQLKASSEGAAGIAGQKNLSKKDVENLTEFNFQTRETLKLLGQNPKNNFFGDLSLGMPKLAKQAFELVKGFLAFQGLSFITQQLQQVAVQAYQTSKRFEALQKSLQFTSGSEFEGAKNLEFIRKEVDRLSAPLETSVKGFTGLAAAARGTSIEGAGVRKIFTAITQASRVYNLTAEQTEGALLAVQQMISKGSVQAEELRCYDRHTEVLTCRGWVRWDEISKEDSFASKNLETGEIEYQQPIRTVRYRYKGLMLRVNSNHIDLLVTPDHRMVVRTAKDQKFEIVKARNLVKTESYFYSTGFDTDEEALVDSSNLEWVEFDDEVFCMEVPFTTLYVRRAGKPCWSGNSQFGERIPGAVQVFARGIGVSTAELNKMLEGGKVGLDDLLKAMDQLYKETADGVVGAVGTSAAAEQRLANSFANLNKSIGDALQPAAIAIFNTLSTSLDFAQKNATLAKAAFATLALSLTIAMLPSVIALGAALTTFATVTLPAVTAATLAAVAANPFLIASLVALAATFVLAEEGAKALSQAITGISEAQIKQADADASLDFKYNASLKQLQQQIPLTKEQVDELTKGLDDQAKRGVTAASTAEVLKNQLLKLQTQAEATAKAQAELNKSVADSAIAFKKAKGEAELKKLGKELSLAQARARGSIGEDAGKDKEYEIEQTSNLELSSLYANRIAIIKSHLAESERLQKLGRKGLEAKQEKEYRDDLLSTQKEYDQAQISLNKTEDERKKVIRERRLKDFEESESILDSQRKQGLINEQQAIEKRLAIATQKTDEELRMIQDRRSKLNPNDKEGLEALAVEEAAVYAKLADARKARYDGQFSQVKDATDRANAYLEAQRKRGLTSEQEAAVQSVAIATQSANAQQMLVKQRLAEVPKTDTTTRDQLLVQEQQALASVSDAQKSAFDSQINATKAHGDRLRTIAQANRDRGLTDERETANALAQAQITQAQQELDLIQQRRSQLNAADKAGLEQLQAQESEALASITKAQKQAFDSQLGDIKADSEKRLAILVGDRARGLITESQFNEQQYQEKEAALDEELALVEQRRSQIAATDIEGQLEVEAKEAEIYQRRIDNQKAFLDAQLHQLEREQQKARDAVTQSATEREIELQKLINARVLNEEEARVATTNLARKGIEDDIRLEEKKLARLLALPKYDDPVAEDERQAKIRASKLQTSKLQLQLLQNEKQQQEAVYAAYAKSVERITQAITNRATATTQALDKELLLNSALEKSLNRQNQLLEAKKGLYTALNNYIQSEFQILEDTAKNDREKKVVKETAAQAKLDAARQQVELDRQSLELQIQQNEQAQLRLEIENQIAQVRNQAEIAKAEAKIATVARTPNATPEDKIAAQLELDAALMEREGLLMNESMLAQGRATNDRVNQMKRNTLEYEAGAQISRVEYEKANAIANPRERRKALRELNKRARMRVTGTDGSDYISRLKDYNAATRGEAQTPLQAYMASEVGRRVNPQLPTTQLIASTPVFSKAVSDFGTAVGELTKLIKEKLSTPATVSVTSPINNYFNNQNQQGAAGQVTQQIRQSLRDLGLELQRAI